MTRVKDIQIGSVSVGDYSPARFMAELGTFYNQDIEKALNLIDVAVAAGADIIKTEILHNPGVVLDREDVTVTYNHASGSKTEKYFDLIKRKCVSLENYKLLLERASSHKIPFVASVYDFEGIDFLASNGGSAVKIWRNNYNNTALLQAAGETKLPVIFDFSFTAPSDMLKAVETVFNAGASGVCVNYHPGHNPTPSSEHDLRLIETYKRHFNTPIGLSCHYRGEEIMYAAIGAGVNLVEKGVYDNINEVDQNVISASSSSKLKQTIDSFKNCANAMGSGAFQSIQPNSIEYGFVSNENISQGQTLTWENLKLAFPNRGISCEYANLVIGAEAKTEIGKGEVIEFCKINIFG